MHSLVRLQTDTRTTQTATEGPRTQGHASGAENDLQAHTQESPTTVVEMARVRPATKERLTENARSANATHAQLVLKERPSRGLHRDGA